MSFTFSDLGGCGCGGYCCMGTTCAVPAHDLAFNYHNNNTGLDINTTLAYSASPGSCFYTSPCLTVPGGFVQLILTITNTCSTIIIKSSPTSCATLTNAVTFANPAGCIGGSTAFSVTTCSPLNIRVQTGAAPFINWTITDPNPSPPACPAVCQPCNLPLGGNAVVSWNDAGGDTGAFNMPYAGIVAPFYQWGPSVCQASNNSGTATNWFQGQLQCNTSTGVTFFTILPYTGPGCANAIPSYFWNSTGTGAITLVSVSCSPLNFVFTHGGFTWTMTL